MSTWESSAHSRAWGRARTPSHVAGLHVLVLIGAIAWAYRGRPRDAPAKGRVCTFLQGVACSQGALAMSRARQSPGSSGKGRGVANPDGPATRPRSPGPPFSCRQDAPGMHAPAPWARNTGRNPSPCHSPGLFAGLTCVCPCQPKEEPTQGQYGPRVGVRGILVDAANKDSACPVPRMAPNGAGRAASRRYQK